MVEQPARPLTDFRVVKALNGGWILTPNDRDPGFRPDAHAFTTAADMLAALPGLIGETSERDEARLERLTMDMVASECGRSIGTPSSLGAVGYQGVPHRLVPREG